MAHVILLTTKTYGLSIGTPARAIIYLYLHIHCRSRRDQTVVVLYVLCV